MGYNVVGIFGMIFGFCALVLGQWAAPSHIAAGATTMWLWQTVAHIPQIPRYGIILTFTHIHFSWRSVSDSESILMVDATKQLALSHGVVLRNLKRCRC